MNALTIPDLNLFHNRRTSIHQPDPQFLRYDHSGHSRKNDYFEKTLYHPIRQNKDYFGTSTRGVSVHSRYKQIAQDYLQKRNRSPTYFIDSTPYVHSIPSFLPKATSTQLRNCRGECENELGQKQYNQNKNTYFWLDKNRTRQTKLLKDPYLQPTFREGGGFINHQRPTREDRHVPKIQSKIQSSVYHHQMNQISNSKIMQKLKTHQSDELEQRPKKDRQVQVHQAMIQTDKPSTINQSILTEKKRFGSELSRPPVQKILQQQKLLIESLKMEVDKQTNFNNQMDDLQSTKNDYIQKSRELLLKLNQLADDKREFSFIAKVFSEKKRGNVFRDIDV